jgi:hypothetical protein
MTRAVPLVFVLLTISVAASPVSPRPGDPSVDGKDYLLSDADFRALLAVARAKLVTLAPHSGIFDVKVISSTKVYAYYGDRSTGLAHHLVLERVRGSWRVTDAPRLPDQIYKFEEEDVIIT